jgi:hypothetical protein
VIRLQEADWSQLRDLQTSSLGVLAISHFDSSTTPSADMSNQNPSTPVKVPSSAANYTAATLDPDLRSQINSTLIKEGLVTKYVSATLGPTGLIPPPPNPSDTTS